MATTTLAGRTSGLPAVDLGELPLWTLAAAASVLFGLMYAVAGAFPDAMTFADTDDATRMVQVRELMDGASWFDTTLPRFGGDYMLYSHWSRLVDLPVATLIAVFRLVLEPQAAEVAARVVWPLLLLAGLFLLVARAAEQRGGRRAGAIAIVLTMLCMLATPQFAPGRIDHHNVMILAAVSGALLLAGSVSKPALGWLAGFALGFGIAVGYEAILYTVLTLVAAAIMTLVTGRGQAGLRRAALAFASTLSVAFLLTTAPERWFDVYCDALSLNMVLLASAAATGLTAVVYMRPSSPALRVAGLAATGVLGIALFATVEPACIRGPFGQVDPRLWPEWLNMVRETQSLGWYWTSLPVLAVVYLVHMALGLAASLAMWRRDRDPVALRYTVFLWLWSVPSIWQVKLVPYAAVLAIPAIAIAIARLPGTATLSAAATHVIATTMLSQQVMFGTLSAVVPGSAAAMGHWSADLAVARECSQPASLLPLAHLTPGLALAPYDLGPVLVASTALSAYAAPYHRLGKQIIAANDIFRSASADVELKLRQTHIYYIVICRPEAASARALPPGLYGDLMVGRAPDYLLPVRLHGPTPLAVWRLR